MPYGQAVRSAIDLRIAQRGDSGKAGPMQSAEFYSGVPTFDRFEALLDAANYRPLPEDWMLVCTDIVNSTDAAQQGRYKSVNMAGASLIAAVRNACGIDLPFAFGGDGALVAVPGSLRAEAEAAVAAVQTWVAEELGLEIRGAVVPMADVRASGRDVLVARFRASQMVDYAMFAGGGVRWADAMLKAGHYGVAPAPTGARPDLTGLSCRWSPVASRNGVVLSLIAVPVEGSDPRGFVTLLDDISAICRGAERDGNPIGVDRLRLGYPAAAIGMELSARTARRVAAWLKVHFEVFLVNLLRVVPASIGGFQLIPYKEDLVANSDFRKFDDGLKMTLDVDGGAADLIELRLERAAREGVCIYGVQRQKEALLTCLVATARQRDHMHFVDGAAGGYAVAASRLKSRARA
jgi:hypothetical protein